MVWQHFAEGAVMGCALQLSLLVLGIWLCTRSRIMLGMQELRSPFTIFAGLILIIQLPLAMGAGLALGTVEGIKAAREGVAPGIAQSRFVKKYWWLDLAAAGSSLALAGCVVLAGSREPVLLPPPPDDEPVGIVDLRRVMAEKQRANEREFEEEAPVRSRRRQQME